MENLYSPDTRALEKKAGQKAARTLKRDLKAVLGVLSLKEGSKLLRNTSISTVIRFDTLDHLSVKTPHYIFKQHYGFEGIKANGVAMRMKPFNHFTNLFDKTKSLDRLLDEIGSIRADEITKNIRF